MDGGHGKPQAVGIKDVKLTESYAADVNNSPDAEEAQQTSLRVALRENSPVFIFYDMPRPHFSHKLINNHCSETWWLEKLWILLPCFFLDIGALVTYFLSLTALAIILFVLSFGLLVFVKLYKVSFNYETRICEISYFRFLGNCWFPSRQASIPFDQITCAKGYGTGRNIFCNGYCYVSLVVDNKTSVRVTRYAGLPIAMECGGHNYTPEEMVEQRTQSSVKSINKFINNVLHNKDLQIEASSHREDGIKELW